MRCQKPCFRRNEFSILKEFKAGEVVGRDSAPASSDFDFWKSFIHRRAGDGHREVLPHGHKT